MSYKLWKGQFPLSHILALFFSESLSFCLKLLYLCFFCNIDSWIAAISKTKFLMYKDWTFLLNVQRNAKKGKRAKDMSWIVNATGWSRLASPISLKQCTHPLRRVRPRNPWYCGCSGDKGGGNKDPRSRRTDSTRLRLPRPSDASLDPHPVQHNPDPLKMFQRAQKRADCVIVGSLFHTTPRAPTANLTSHQNKWFGTWLRILPPQWVRHRSYQSISASQRREGYHHQNHHHHQQGYRLYYWLQNIFKSTAQI